MSLFQLWKRMAKGLKTWIDILDTGGLWERAYFHEGTIIYPQWSSVWNEEYTWDTWIDILPRMAPISTFTLNEEKTNLPRVGARIMAYDAPYRIWRRASIIDRDETRWAVKVHWWGYTAKHEIWVENMDLLKSWMFIPF